MQFNDQQESALAALKDYAEAGSSHRPYVFTGLAGTGKTTVVARLILELEASGAIEPARIAVIAFTGKAASVLNKKLVAAGAETRARTIHSLIYTMPIDKTAHISEKLDKIEAAMTTETDESALSALRAERHDMMNLLKGTKNDLKFQRKPPIEVKDEFDLIIVDEASMVDAEIAAHLTEVGLPTIYVGDANQLPPVNKAAGVDLKNPDAKLTQIMRQQGDSGIVPFAHAILQSKALPSGAFDGVTRDMSTNPLRFIKDGALPQFVTAFNNTRHRINQTIRRHVLGVEPKSYLPIPGEKLMVDANRPQQRLLKGDILEVLDIAFENDMNDGDSDLDAFLADNLRKVVTNTSQYRAVATMRDQYGNEVVDTIYLNDLMHSMGADEALDPQEDKRRHLKESYGALPVMYPYAITCYKAQGSEWDRVVVFNERPRTYIPYLYTAATRAKNELIVVGK